MFKKILETVSRLLKHSFVLLVILAGCSQSKEGLKVAASPVPHAEMLEEIKGDLKQQGITLVIIPTDDYNMPNRALAEGEVDANFFQHAPFLEAQVKEFHYPIERFAKIEIEPMGIYSMKISSLSNLRENGVVAIPNDPTNEGRALFLLQDQGLIRLNTDSLQATVLNISDNPKKLQFIEADAAMLPRTLSDVDLAVINTNYALAAHYIPEKDALALESPDSPYANLLVIRKGEEGRADLEALKEALTSEKMRCFIEKKYKGAVLPAF